MNNLSSFCQGTHCALHLSYSFIYSGLEHRVMTYFQKSQCEPVAEPEKGTRNLCSLTHPVRRVPLTGIFEDVKK